MEFNREISLVESYTLTRKEYDHILFTQELIWSYKDFSENPSEEIYTAIRNTWCFGIFE